LKKSHNYQIFSFFKLILIILRINLIKTLDINQFERNFFFLVYQLLIKYL